MTASLRQVFCRVERLKGRVLAFMTERELREVGFGAVGRDVSVSTRAAIYTPELIELGDRVRIDDFCVLAGRISLGRNIHIAAFSNLAGGRAGIWMHDFSGLAYGSHIIAQSDDYSGEFLHGPTVPAAFKRETSEPVIIESFSIVGAGSIVLQGVTLREGTSLGAGAVATRSTEPWSTYVGVPARKVGDKTDASKALVQQYLATLA